MDPEMITTAKIAPLPAGATGEAREDLLVPPPPFCDPDTLPSAARVLAPAIAVRRRFFMAAEIGGAFRAWTVAANIGRAMEALAMLDLADVSTMTLTELSRDQAQAIRLKGDADHPEHTTLAVAPIGAVYSTET